jgi:hypothetical protein
MLSMAESILDWAICSTELFRDRLIQISETFLNEAVTVNRVSLRERAGLL